MGTLLEPLDATLSSRSKVRLLRVLLTSSQPLSGREAARLARVARVPAARSLDDLVALGVLNRETTVAQHLYTVNRDSFLVRSGLEALYRAERERVDAIFGWLRSALEQPELKDGIEAAWIFGSSARGEDTSASDLDLLVVVRDAQDEDRVHTSLSERAAELEKRFGLSLSPVVLTAERVRSMHASGHGLVHDVLRDGRSVLGRDLARILR
jgi:predicted nucleotidyltransferase